MAVVMMFVDGLGLGDDDPARNPVMRAHMPNMRRLLAGRPLTASAIGSEPVLHGESASLVAVDANLGVPGLPQSATGQTALFTGKNASAVLGRHMNGLPTKTLLGLLNESSIFKQLRAAGLRPTFANPFTNEYFAAVEAGRWRHSGTTAATLAGGIPLRMLEDLAAGQAVFHDMTGEGLVVRGHAVNVVEPEVAGARLAALAANHDFTLFEHFLTDKAGHAQDMEAAVGLLERLDVFLGALLAELPPHVTLLLISDHGNVEDLGVKTHTRNPVPGLCVGPARTVLTDGLASLLDVTPALVSHLTGRPQGAHRYG